MKSERLSSSDGAAGDRDGAPSDLCGGPHAGGLDLLGYAAFTPEHLRLSFLLPAAAATPINPPKPAGLDETSVAVVASERPDRRVTVCAGPASSVSLGLARKDPAHVSLSVASLAVAPDADH